MAQDVAFSGMYNSGRSAVWFVDTKREIWGAVQWLFLLEGLPAIALGLIVFFFLPASPAAASFLAPEECEWLVSRSVDELSCLKAFFLETRVFAQPALPFYDC